ncbi:hypothetical protein [Stenotrophomonas oahuensis]|uniref:DUF4375 domain-containing protein n=1 Tax=Stenotrophomonas oahuensis TaxID=3003271 RepID=A0ABY9YLI1_9GAMM|nr:hypothetical protein [Stenotrophomonas sp. A5586]WNH51119.1 hypothetical protein PDM29_12145 [Stenotrophomonas sp. A5586]
MHPFSDLAARCAAMSMSSTDDARQSVLALLQESGSAVLVKALQAVELQRAMMAVGLVSMFEAALQAALGEENGFGAARKLLREGGHERIEGDFADIIRAINVLKHGAGRSHDELLARRMMLPFKVRTESECFEEGDVSELIFLVKVDDEFFQYCASAVAEVAAIVRALKPEAIL